MLPGILAIDIGGLSIKAAVTDIHGVLISQRVRVATPQPCPPSVLVDLIANLISNFPPFNRISIGFPGVIQHGRILTAVNLQSEEWVGFDLTQALSQRLGEYPARIINDADMIGLAVVAGKGLEIVITLGNGFGTAVLRNGELMPHMELAHHPIADGKTYDQYLGDAALKDIGRERWNSRLTHALDLINILFHPDHIVLSGGNASNVDIPLPSNTRIVSDVAGLSGGAAMWRKENYLPVLFSG